MALTTAITPKWAAEITVNPTSAATNLSLQNLSYSAARPEDILIYQTPDSWVSAGFVIVNAHCNSASNILLTYLNLSGGGLDVAADTVRFTAV